MLSELGKRLVDLVFPPSCVICGNDDPGKLGSRKSTSRSALVCSQCRLELFQADLPACPRCSARVKIPENFDHCCHVCRDSRWKFDSLATLGNYQGAIRDVVLELKKPGNENIARHMGRLLASESLSKGDHSSGADVIVFTPGQWRRKILTHSNPAESIAEGVSEVLGLPILMGILEFNRETEKQGMLSRLQRFENVRGSIDCSDQFELGDKVVLLIDDVVTSGATASDAARALKKAGAAEVRVAAIARGIGFN